MKPVSKSPARKSQARHKPARKAEIRARTGDKRAIERVREPVERLLARRRMRDDLGDHRIVIGRDLAAGLDPGIDPDAVALENSSAASFPVDGRKPRSGSSA